MKKCDSNNESSFLARQAILAEHSYNTSHKEVMSFPHIVHQLVLLIHTFTTFGQTTFILW